MSLWLDIMRLKMHYKFSSNKRIKMKKSSTMLLSYYLVIWLAYMLISMIEAQYSHYPVKGYNNYYGRGYDSSTGAEEDERPRIKVGLRLRVPAFKVELPPVSLPKITINAKVRQPNQPRVIRLPEINLDTSSKVSAPGFGAFEAHRGMSSGSGDDFADRKTYGSRGYAASALKPSYTFRTQRGNTNSGSERIQSFSFSTDEQITNNMNKPATYQVPNYYPSSVNQYRVHHLSPARQIHANNHMHSLRNQYQSDNYNRFQSTDADVGFNEPAYTEMKETRA